VRDVVESIRAAAVTATGTNDMPLSSPAAFDFAEFIRPLTILGKLAGLRRVPSRVRAISATSGSGAYWAGEAQPRPISRMTFDGETLEPLSVTAILVATAELLQSSSPNAESLLSRDLAAAAVAAMDQAFIDPANAGTPGVKPAAITHGVGAFVSSGSTLAQIDSDLDLLINALSDAGSDLQFATFVMPPRTALYLARLRGTGGTLAYPGLTAKGGTLLGLPAIASAGVPSAGSPYISSITLLDPSQILLADESGGAVETSTEGALQMQDAPGSGAQNLVSLWQTNSAALKVTRYANWQRCRAGMARVLTGVSY
jgi:HK97 family phage major capsid protein